jgi:heat shock protein beta
MGVIDSDDLPLNVNRQTLVQSKTFKIINQKITKKILDMIQEIAKWDDIDEEEYEEDFEYEFEEEELEKFTEDELKQKKE